MSCLLGAFSCHLDGTTVNADLDTPKDNGASQLALEAPRRRRRLGLSIQSKLLIMLLGVSLVSSVIVGVIGFVNGRQGLQDAAFDQLVAIREMRAEAIEREFASLQSGVRLDSRNASAVEGARAFIEGFAALQDSPLDGPQLAALREWYDQGFIPALEDRSGLNYDANGLMPASNAGQHLQSLYTAGRDHDDFDAGLALTDAGDGSDWTKANIQYGPYFAGLVEEVGYEDVLIIDGDGNVVYSAYKAVDLGISLERTPYANSALTAAFNRVMQTGSLDEVVTTDFERYIPSLNVPTAWVVSPLGTSDSIDGVMAIQVPVDQINSVMTGGQQWTEQGLGETGEVYLAASDGLMRSESRLLVEDPDEYLRRVTRNGTPVETAERVVTVSGTVLLQPVDFFAVAEAGRGQTGAGIAPDYTGVDSLVAYAPLDIDGLDWVIVAHIDQSEAFGPVTQFTRNLILSTLAIMLGVSVLSLLLAQVFSHPVRRLMTAVRGVAAGDLAVQAPEGSSDEFGDLGSAFNDMAASLRIKQDLIDDQHVENEKLLHTLMPQTVADRYKKGEEAIAEHHDNVSVVFAELIGFDDFARGLSDGEEVASLNVLMRGFDEAAEKAGVEKVRTLRGGYLAASGLIVPRVDNVRRTVDFAVQLRSVIERFNAQNSSSLTLRAGVDTGEVTSGLVARTNLAYDLWGDAVNLAHRVRSVTGEPGIYVSQAVQERLQGAMEFAEAGAVDLRGTSQTVWRVAES